MLFKFCFECFKGFCKVVSDHWKKMSYHENLVKDTKNILRVGMTREEFDRIINDTRVPRVLASYLNHLPGDDLQLSAALKFPEDPCRFKSLKEEGESWVQPFINLKFPDVPNKETPDEYYARINKEYKETGTYSNLPK